MVKRILKEIINAEVYFVNTKSFVHLITKRFVDDPVITIMSKQIKPTDSENRDTEHPLGER